MYMTSCSLPEHRSKLGLLHHLAIHCLVGKIYIRLRELTPEALCTWPLARRGAQKITYTYISFYL